MPDIHDYAAQFIRAQPWHWDTLYTSEDGVAFSTIEAAGDFNRYLAHEGYLTHSQFENNVALEQDLRDLYDSKQ